MIKQSFTIYSIQTIYENKNNNNLRYQFCHDGGLRADGHEFHACLTHR